MSLREKIREAWGHSQAARQVWIRQNIVDVDPVPTYSWHDLRDGLGR